MTSERIADRILRFVGGKSYRPQKLRALARSMGVAEDEYGEFRDTIKALTKTGRLVLGSSKVVTLPQPAGTIVGTFRLNPRGFGFVIPESPDAHGDLFVPPGYAHGAITGDTVVAKIVKRGKRHGKMLLEGRIVEIVARGQNHFVGELCRDIGRWYVRPDGNTLHGPVFVEDPGAKSAKRGDQVVIEVIRYPEAGREAQGVIVRVLGKRGNPEVDTLSIIVQHQLPEGFSDLVIEAASRAAQSYDPDDAADGRTDLRHLPVITIDPDDARDFDDAISITTGPGDALELGVHIADVGHFVEAGGALDGEAFQRSNSVYFPKFVIPMLPEVVSNGVCSLQEGQPRLTKSVFITYDGRGRVLRTRFANSIVSSAKRLTYKQATAVLEGRTKGVLKPVVALLKQMESLAKTIQRRRMADGMLVLDLPEVELVFDDDDNVVGTQQADTGFSHTIIEMFMVEANEAVGRLLAGIGVPHLRRVHPDPDEAAGGSLAKFLGAVGIKTPKTFDRAALQSVLKKVQGQPASFAVNLAVLRTFQLAEYSPKLIGHYALASDHYVHFTSPIRRYPDLTIHRLLDSYLRGELDVGSPATRTPDLSELHKTGEQCSRNERRAEAAERELRLVKILRLLERRIGDHLEGIVTGVTNFGIFVQLPQYLVDGLLRFEEMADDWWEVDADLGRVVAERSGQRISIGQLIEVAIARVDVASRQLDLSLVGRTDAGVKTDRRSSAPKGRGGRRSEMARRPRRKSGPKTGAGRRGKRR